MKRQKVTVLIEQDEDGYYVASIPALRSCYTQAKTLPVLRKRIAEVIKLCLVHEKPAKQQFVAVEQMEIMA
ncbi:MAG: type II toxin-antitoxin system HicB family antitoxin [Planctomycetes bacterium]|nr:type II toxin-antitoxin system HicB family antitoxin [Planctomycetota bacterium]